MLNFILKHRIYLAALTILILWSILFIAWIGWIRGSPLKEEITLLAGSTIEKEVHIKIPEIYTIHLLFDRQGVSDAELRALVGERRYSDGIVVPSGVVVPIHWSLRSSTSGLVVANKSIESFGTDGYSGNNFYRPIGYVKVPAGKYIFQLKILQDVPQFNNFKTKISVALGSAGASTWHLKFAFWGELATVLLILPLVLILVLFILFRAGLEFSARKSRKPVTK